VTPPTPPIVVGLADPSERAAYLAGLNACFPGWGDASMFAWCFDRIVAGRTPDLLHVEDGDAMVAGSAITYRHVAIGGAAPVPVGIMTGSWTLPTLRGRGVFSRFIDASCDLSAKRGCAHLVAFVTRTNPSSRRLAAAGATLLPTYYCRCARRGSRAEGETRDVDVDALTPEQFVRSTRATRFAYTLADWRGQFLDRVHPVRAVRHSSGWTAVIERTAQQDRLLALSVDDAAWTSAVDVLARQAASAERDLFLFTADGARAAALRDRGDAVSDGALAILDTRLARTAARGRDDSHGASDAPPLEGAPCAWTPLDVQAGDRM